MINRNAPCSCGSGKRYKHCCGQDGVPTASPKPATRSEALAAHRAGSLRLAESLYRRALEQNPRDVDVLHMLGVVQLERLRYCEALDLILEAAERTDWKLPQVRHNLGLVLAKLLVRGDDARKSLVDAFLAWEQSQSRSLTGGDPLVSIVLPAYNHARYVGEALASVAAQTYRKFELIVIDDGSFDGTAEVIAKELQRLELPARFVSRPNRGAPATLNEGAALATGRYLAFLNSDDYYAPDRLAALVDGIARPGIAWGFSLVAQVTPDSKGEATDGTAPAGSYWQLQRSLLGSDSNSFALLQHNVAVSTGNLFVERELFASLGGFRDLRFNHDWDFCLRAAALAEPMVVRRPLYFYRLHGANTIRESKTRPKAEADQVLGEVIAGVLAGTTACTNPLAPQWPANRALTLTRMLSAGQGALVPVGAMRKLAAEVRARVPLPPAPGLAPLSTQRTAVVVLGMHRSGTSALARVLNLCGLHLPAELRAPNIYHNPTGFWEPEAIVNFNDRVLRQLGGAWNAVNLDAPNDAFVDEFMNDVRSLLAAEYGEEPAILIKDPRIALLAPLWHRALEAAGYRVAYVIPVRDPLEVARSLEARGDMSVAEGVALWTSYMKRIAAFGDSADHAIHLRFTDLIDDWRRVVGAISSRLNLALDVHTRESEIDRFLEPSLRRQRTDPTALEALPDGTENADARAVYNALIARCERESGVAASRTLAGGDSGRSATAPTRRTALIVLGMHRSGTSAYARVLNLCGAHLPANLRPPKLRNNPKGSWEPEEVVALNERVLRHLGGAWNLVDFELPEDALRDEFAHDVVALLAAEYGGAATILIKDPRVCVLAPLWHAALDRAGYRPVYVVPVRDPLEVAQSLHERGDMSVSEGLALWLSYMQRVVEFSDTGAEMAWVRYTDLLDDWRGVIGRVGKRLQVDLDLEAQAAEVDRFVEPALRRQRSDDSALDALPPGEVADDVRALYQVCLDWCDEDAKAAQRSQAPAKAIVETRAWLAQGPLPTASFVLCIENNAIKDQALMLCESIREFGGAYRRSPIVAFSPRAGLAVDRETRRMLADLDVEYVDEPINTTCRDYAPANRVFAGAWAEARSNSDFLVVMDSDTVLLREPELPRDADAAARPVDTKGSATRGPGDAFEEYWRTLAAMSGISLDRLPFTRSTIEGERIRASYNAGLIVCRREKGIFARGAELFSRSLEAGMRPYRGSGIDIYASTGPVGQAGSEFWGSSQAVLAIAIWATTSRVVHFPGSYNLPLHMVAGKGSIDPQWTAEPPVHVHYHYMFSPQRHEVAMAILEELGVPADRRAWLAARIPFRELSEARQVA